MEQKLDPLIKRIYKSIKLKNPDNIVKFNNLKYEFIIDFLEKEK